MVFERTISEDLAHWKASLYRKPLIIRGARQVGKTTIIREFGTIADAICVQLFSN